MIKSDSLGKYVMALETDAVIRRIPIPKYGTSQRGVEWTLGSLIVEAYDQDETKSAELCFNSFDPEMIELFERIGVGKRVHICYHISCRRVYDNYHISLMVDSIVGLSDGEDYLYGTKKGGTK